RRSTRFPYTTLFRSPENVVHVAELSRIDVENADVSSHACRDLTGRATGDAGAENHDFPRPHSGGTAEKNSTSAVFRLETPRANLNRQPAGDFAHGREQWQRAVIQLNRFVADGGDSFLEEHPSYRFAGGEVKISEEDQSGT